MSLQWKVMPQGWEWPKCSAPSPGGRMRCEYPPDHRLGEAGVADHHCGRDRLGRWRTWPIRLAADPDRWITSAEAEG